MSRLVDRQPFSLNEGAVHSLADGDDDRIALDGRVPSGGGAPPSSADVVGTQFQLVDHEASHRTRLVPQHRLGRHIEDHADAFLEEFGHLTAVGRHLLATAAVGDGDIAAQAPQGTGHIDGDVAASDDDHPIADAERFPFGLPAQHLSALDDPLSLRAFESELTVMVGAQGEDHRIIGRFERCDADLLAQHGIEPESHPQEVEELQLLVEHIARKAVGWDAVAQDPTGLMMSIVDGHLVAEADQVERRREAGRACAHDGDSLARGGPLLVDHPLVDLLLLAHLVEGVGQVAVQLTLVDGVVDLLTPTAHLTVEVTDPPQRTGQGVVLQRRGEGFQKPILLEERDVGRDAHRHRTGVGAELSHQRLAGAGVTPPALDVALILLGKVPDGRRHRVHRTLAQATEGGIADVVAELLQEDDIFALPLPLADPVKDRERLGEPLPAGGALAARL